MAAIVAVGTGRAVSVAAGVGVSVGSEVEFQGMGKGVDPGLVGSIEGTSFLGTAVTAVGTGLQAVNTATKNRYRNLKMGLMNNYGVEVKWAVGVRVGVGVRYHIGVRVGVRVGGMRRVGVTSTSGG
jgi:hypothetical protein